MERGSTSGAQATWHIFVIGRAGTLASNSIRFLPFMRLCIPSCHNRAHLSCSRKKDYCTTCHQFSACWKEQWVCWMHCWLGLVANRISTVSGLSVLCPIVRCYVNSQLKDRHLNCDHLCLSSQLLPLRLGVRCEFLGQRHSVSRTSCPLHRAPRVSSSHP